MTTNLRTALIFGGFISLIGAAFYPIYFRPLMRLEEYQKEQAINRAGIVQEDVQPPGKRKNHNKVSRVLVCCRWGWCFAAGEIFASRLDCNCAVISQQLPF
uniref:Small integral membrane protein 20 n=1 Tax=Phocoena sinus TaxID=42100 RepID=A0A8C9EBP0_PHOSS